MKMFKLSSILLLAVLFTLALTPELSAKTRTSLSFNFNVGAPNVAYVETWRPAYYRPYYCEERVYYPSPYPYPYREQIIIERPYTERVYVHPHYSYWEY